MTIATIKKEIKDLKNALNTNLDEKFKVKLREQLSKSEKTLAEMESAKTPTAKKTATKKANVVAKKSTSVLQKVKQANKKAEPKKSTPAKKSTAKQPSALQKIKNQVKLNKNLSGYKKSGIDLLRDGNRPALPSGKRISKDGNPYYEYRLNRVDVRQPSKKVAKPNKLEHGGMMADGGEIRGGIRYVKGKELEWVDIKSFDIATYGDKEAERKAYEYIQDSIKYWNGELNEDDFRVRKSGSGGYLSSWEVMRQFPKYADGGMMAKGGKTLFDILYENKKPDTINYAGMKKNIAEGKLKTNQLDNTLNALTGIYDTAFDVLDVSENDVITNPNKQKQFAEFMKDNDADDIMTLLAEKPKYDTIIDGMFNMLDGMGYGVLNNYFALRGYYGSDTYNEYKNYYNENPKMYLNPSIIKPEMISYEDGMMAKGGRLKSALMRDRAYKSNEPYEQAYKRKTRPKNPKYNYGFFEDGGSTEMHRAYAMGGVLQHGLESGDFIVSHDEGKMVVMNGGSKYEVNIHSGSRTKID